MAIDNNYEGPPSLEIYQDFVQSASIGEIDQNVVIVAQHYDVFKASEVSDSRFFVKYTAGSTNTSLTYNKETIISDIDPSSVCVALKSAIVAQGKATNCTLPNKDTNTTIIDVEIDVTDVEDSKMDLPVEIGDTVLIEYTTGSGKKTVVTEIRKISASSDEGVYSVIHVGKEIHSDATGIVVYFGKNYRPIKLTAESYISTPTGVTLRGDITIDSGVVGKEAMRVISGDAFLEYRSISRKYNNTIGYITSNNISELGYIGIENPLGIMVSVALKGGKGVYCLSVNADTKSEYNKAFSLLSRSTTAYAIVLGSLREDVIAAADTFVTSMANESVANYKILYYGLNTDRYVPVMDGSNVGGTDEYWMASVESGVLTIENTSPTENFHTLTIEPGDIVRIGYAYDEYAKETYLEFKITDVTDKHTVTLDDATYSTDEITAFKVYRELEGAKLVDVLKKRVCTTNHRSYCVFGDGITVDGIKDAPAWLLAALPAGMRAGEYCQRPISNLTYSGCTANNTMRLGSEDLKSLASRGVWILANTLDGNSVYNYHQLSTDMSSKKKQEQSYTTNFDNISRQARALLSPYYGNSNISEDFLQQINTELRAFLGGKTTNAPSVEVGPQLIKFENLVLIQDPVNLDHVDMEVDYYMPAPFNHVKLRQRLM